MPSITLFPTIANASAESSTRDREWWRVESARVGSDWESIGVVVARTLWKLQFTSSLAWSSTS
jgi:hypothetical protein